MADKTFAEGFTFSRRENQPSFVVGRLSCNVTKAIEFLTAHADERGWVNMNIKQSQKGTDYVELDTWKPQQKKDGSWTPKAEPVQVDEDSIPF